MDDKVAIIRMQFEERNAAALLLRKPRYDVIELMVIIMFVTSVDKAF